MIRALLGFCLGLSVGVAVSALAEVDFFQFTDKNGGWNYGLFDEETGMGQFMTPQGQLRQLYTLPRMSIPNIDPCDR